MVLNFLFLPPTSETACIWWNCAIVFSVNTACIWNIILMSHDVGRVWANTPNTCTEHGTVACTWPSSEYDCIFRPQYNYYDKKYKHRHHTGTVGQAIVQWSSPTGMLHTVYLYGCATHWQHIMCSAGHMGSDVAHTEMAWTGSASPVWDLQERLNVKAIYSTRLTQCECKLITLSVYSNVFVGMELVISSLDWLPSLLQKKLMRPYSLTVKYAEMYSPFIPGLTSFLPFFYIISNPWDVSPIGLYCTSSAPSTLPQSTRTSLH